MTESEARTKECPIYVATVSLVLRHTADPQAAEKNLRPHYYCRGSKCMMWRDAGKLLDLKSGGYCGLAGKP